ncbi:uncharacterized protein LOC135842440 isoform X2 [Planococcus citri]|uniref:uncharacterized protein LOC135842440 isoform X2 n=1 Tax=Planococcus citri TaxID=170843 RepID=UPI0031F8B136
MSSKQPHEENRIVDGSNDPYVYFHTVPNLKELASHEVARGIWCSVLEKFHLYNEQYSSHQDRCVQLMKDLNIPGCIKNTLQNDLQEVDRSMKQWADHFLFYMKFPKTFSKYHYDIPNIDPNWLVWSTNGEIDCLKTAKNMLQADCLTNVQKFIIMSAYCMEDEMKNFSLDSLPAKFYANVRHSNGWVFFYWICYLRNESGEELGYRAMAENFNIRDRFINEYFWSLLNADDQVAVATHLLICVSYQSKEKQKYGRYYATCTRVLFGRIIAKMTCNQRQRLLAANMGIYFSLVCSNSPGHVLRIWRRSKNDVTEKNFSIIIGELLFRSKHNPVLISSLTEIWDTASDSQRNYLIRRRSRVCSYIDFCLRNPNLLKFVNKLLDHFSSNERKGLIFKVAESPRFHECSPESFNYLVNSFLPNFEDQLALKEFVMQSHHFKKYLYSLLIRDQDFEKFIEKVKFYCSYDASAVQVLKKKFLKEISRLIPHCSDVGLGLITNFNKWKKFSEFIDETFENNLTSRLVVKQEFVKKLITSFENSKNFRPLSHVQLVDFVKVVDESVFADRELKNVKPSVGSLCFVTVMIVQIRIMKYLNQKCAKWCSKDDNIENTLRNWRRLRRLYTRA